MAHTGNVRIGRRFAHAPRAALLALGALAAPAAVVADVSFNDGAFADADWSSVKLMDTSYRQGATFTAEHAPSGGNGGAHRFVTHNLRSGALIVGHTKAGAVYNPATQGEIDALSFSYDLRHFNAEYDRVMGYGLLLVQSNTYYLLNQADAIYDNVWTGFEASGLRPADFIKISGSGPATPNFSAGGAPITFGYYTSNNSTGYLNYRESGIDNWSCTVHTAGGVAACPADYNGDGVADSTDYFTFLDAFFGGSADFNNDGRTDAADFFAFLDAYFAGC